MAPIKFEEHIKDKLEERRLQPSIDAWSKMSERLDVDKNKANKAFLWYAIAASIVGILFVVSQLLNNGTQEIIEPQIVENPEEIEEVESGKATPNIKSGIQKTPEVIASSEKEDVITIFEKEIPKQKIEPIAQEAPMAVAKNVDEPQEVKAIIESAEALKDKLTLEEQKIQQVVTQIQKLKENQNHVTDSEIEDLLQQAQRENTLKQLYNESTGIVDANALLQDVETDIDRSFRDRVFKALRESYGTVKTAVATRND